MTPTRTLAMAYSVSSLGEVLAVRGLDGALVQQDSTYFTWTPSRIGGTGIDGITRELMERHARAYPRRVAPEVTLPPGGVYQWRKEGEEHQYNPLTITSLQKAVRTDDYKEFKVFSSLIDEQNTNLYTLRGLLDFRENIPSVPIEEVEPDEAIMKRFKTGATLYG